MEKQRLRTFIVSLLLSYIVSGLLLFFLALILYKMKIREKQIEVGVYIIYVLSCLLGGFMVGKGMRTKRMFWGLLLAITYFLILLILSYFINQNNPDSSTSLITAFAFCCAGGITGGVMS